MHFLIMVIKVKYKFKLSCHTEGERSLLKTSLVQYHQLILGHYDGNYASKVLKLCLHSVYEPLFKHYALMHTSLAM